MKEQNLSLPILDIVEEVINNNTNYESIKNAYKHYDKSFWITYYCIHDKGSNEIRKKYINAVENKPLDLYAYSNPYLAGIIYKGSVDYSKGLRNIYSSHAVNLNISSLQLETSVNNRVFDCFASGGFLLSDYKDDMRDIFKDFWMDITFNSIQEMNEKISYYLKNSDEREDIIQRATEIIIKEHTYINRAEYIINLVS